MDASFNTRDIEMTSFRHRRFVITLAAMAFAASFAVPAMAQTAAHDHEAAAPHQLGLNQGHKWAADTALRDGMGRIQGLVVPKLSAAHAGKLDAAAYRELAMQVEAEVGNIVANCKLESQADAMLHLVIADLGEGTDAMAGKNAALRPDEGLVKVALAVNAYGSHFDHPGFKPIRNIH